MNLTEKKYVTKILLLHRRWRNQWGRVSSFETELQQSAQKEQDWKAKVDPVSTHVSNKSNMITCKSLSTNAKKDNNIGNKTFIA